jgi:dolichol-phosphate mannosyltransferase
MPLLSVIMPCYFNEQNIPVTIKELISNENNFPADVKFEYVFIDDGSARVSGKNVWLLATRD